jgi:hypothetical protein
MKLIILMFFAVASISNGDTVQFKGSYFDFKTTVAGQFSLVDNDSPINKMLDGFVATKGDLVKAREFYTESSKSKFDLLTKDEKTRLAYSTWISKTTINCKAIIKKKDGKITAFMHVNKNTTGSMIVLAEIEMKGIAPKLVFADFYHPKSGDPEYWIMQFWNAMPNLRPSITE